MADEQTWVRTDSRQLVLDKIKQTCQDYERLGELIEEVFKVYMAENKIKAKFYKGSYSFNDINFEGGYIELYDDDFYNGYDLHDYDYKYMPLDYFVEYIEGNQDELGR